MRIKGKYQVINPMLRVEYGICINGIVVDVSKVSVTNELLHALVVDYSFYRHSINDVILNVHDIVARRKATRRMLHNADKMHKVVDSITTNVSGRICPLLSRGKPYAWNQEVYDFNSEKFIEKNLR